MHMCRTSEPVHSLLLTPQHVADYVVAKELHERFVLPLL
jgi:hypothetical protein